MRLSHGDCSFSSWDSSAETPLFSFIESCLRHKSEVVIYEAAAAIVRLPRVTAYVARDMRAFHSLAERN